MKICIVTPTLRGGGAEKIAVNLANHYSSEGHDVYLVAFSASGPNLSSVSKSIKIIDLKVRARYCYFKLLRTLRHIDADILFSVMRDSNVFVGLCAPLLRAHCVFREANTLDAVLAKGALLKILHLSLMRISYSMASRIIANSDDTLECLVSQRVVSMSSCVVVPNPVLPSDFGVNLRESFSHKWLGRSEYYTILNVGRLHFQKNQALLLRTFALLSKEFSDVRLVIVGEGEEYDNLKDLSCRLGIELLVDFLPYQSNVYPIFRLADVFVLTSRWEGFGNVIVESMACKTPVISVKCKGGPSKILDGGRYGALVDATEECLCRQLKDFMNQDLEELVNDAATRAELYTTEAICKKYLTVI